MSVFTVHEPPLRAGQALAEPERFLFVRDGFYFWAFLLTLLWMLWHRLWLVLVIYVLVAVGLEFVMYYAGVGSARIAVVELLVSLLIGFEAGTLRRLTLAWRGWKNVGVVSGDNLEHAERRFFDQFVRGGSDRRRTPGTMPALPPQPSHTPDVIGLFPEPGAHR